MNPVDEHAVAEFLKAGGYVSHVKESVGVSEAELLDYLASCGITVKYRAGDLKAYICDGKRVSTSKLIAVANELRRAQDVPPFSLRVAIRYTGPRSDLSKTRS
jgi:hypothetical protein